MNLSNLFEDDHDHGQALRQTGFWGRKGAGCIVFAKDTGRFLINHRSQDVLEPNTWGVWGGAIDANEDPKQAAVREIHEEAGYNGPVDMIPAYVFKSDTFRYYNFIAVVPKEFTPSLDWKSQGFVWCEYGDWPHPLHYGLAALLNDPASREIMMKLK